MNRRQFILSFVGCGLGMPFVQALQARDFDRAAALFTDSVETGQVRGSVLLVRQGEQTSVHAVGEAKSRDAIFLLASISKPISTAAFMTLYDRDEVRLDDPVVKFLPEFRSGGREEMTVKHLLTHTSGLPDQLPENALLRARHAPLTDFIKGAIRTPLLFRPGTRYSYSSMGILVASEIAQRLTGRDFAGFVDETVYQPLGMTRSAMGLGRLDAKFTQRCQVEQAAPESGAGDPSARAWDWNSSYWRHLGAPWGGAHGSAVDVARFLHEFLHPSGKVLREETARLMTRNHNSQGIRPRGLGFDLYPAIGLKQPSKAFGHTGSTGTLCWADPGSDTICVVLTTLPARAVSPHPRDLASRIIAGAIR